MSVKKEDEEYKQAAKVFKALADPTRLRILSIIESESMMITGIVEKFNLSQPTVSYHIRILENAGLVKTVKKGREVYCSLIKKGILKKALEFSKWVKGVE
ncbi:MAG: metalloregulator ArsR/SmtB family transcription factor [Thermoproteota archaeon]|nr:winged helix-turn-helix transcriptional regulator [Candidatus Brockarchaeota archaeon]MBO3840401.1 winged helix-turn-helix transcriptional regulator [Candidatus Brockarchaeota archaeon]